MNRDVLKTRKLEALRKEILSTIPDAWLFPTEGKVQGFMGTSPVVFVAERPATGFFRGPVGLLYSLLEKSGAANSHLTDVIKSRGKVGQPYPEDISPHRQIFDREIEIVRPHLIVAFGQKVYDLLQFSLAGSGVKIRQVWHYSYAGRWPGKRAAFEKQVQKALQE